MLNEIFISLTRYLHFLVMRRNGLIQKLNYKKTYGRLISKFKTSQTWQQVIKMHKLPNILRSNDNQVMKFGQLMKYNLKIIFLEKSYQKWDWNIC